jgi:hypothetical protein
VPPGKKPGIFARIGSGILAALPNSNGTYSAVQYQKSAKPQAYPGDTAKIHWYTHSVADFRPPKDHMRRAA